jgi:hypothetical protein
MDSLQNLPFHDHPSNSESFQTASVSNQSLIDLLNGKLAGEPSTTSTGIIRLLQHSVQESATFLSSQAAFSPMLEKLGALSRSYYRTNSEPF